MYCLCTICGARVLSMFLTWSQVFIASLNELLSKLGMFFLALFGALALFIVGLIIASAAGRIVQKLIKVTRIDDLLVKMGVGEILKHFGLEFTLSSVIGWLAKWFVIIAVLITVADGLGWTQITSFLEEVALYIPNVIIAVVILMIGLIAGQFVHRVILKAAKASRISQTTLGLLAALAKWSIVVFAAMATLIQLGIAQDLLQILFTGFIAMVALAGGLAFGLGGKERAKGLLDKIANEVGQK